MGVVSTGGKDQVARVGKVGSRLAQPGDHRGEGREDRRYVWSSKGVRAGGGLERAFMALVAQGRDQKVANGCPRLLGSGGRRRESLDSQVIHSADVSCEAISGCRANMRQGSCCGNVASKWESSCESVRSQRREASSAMALAVPWMKLTS